jgi:class 3 adenylate cyclase/predicted ATPase
MFTDIVGSTALRDALIATLGGSAGDQRYRERVLDPHDALIRGLLREHRGYEVKTIGDSFMAAFGEAEDAVRCAVAIQRSLRETPIAVDDSGTPLGVRIGMHTGAVTLVEREERIDYDGHAVNIAARVESLLKGGERVYCSAQTKALTTPGPEIRLHSYGQYPLKGLSETVEIFDVLWNEAMQPEPPPQPHERMPYPWLTPWIGREQQMANLAEALRTSRLVTLHGTGGVGKTRLAVEALLARGGGLPREIVFVPLERVADTPDALLRAVRDALGLTEVDAPDYDALCRQLQGGDRLLLLDNFETVMSAAHLVPRLAATAGVRVLVTSQQALDVNGERVVELEPMPTQGDPTTLDSYRLFAGLARQRDARWQPEDENAMHDVLAATDGLPYLIELVAAVAPKRQLRQLADELKTTLTQVRARGKDALRAERHASVEACLEWAITRLPTDERKAFPRLAIFSSGFDAEAAEAIAEAQISNLDVLLDASLLRFDREGGRYAMLTTTREFAIGHVDSDEKNRLIAAHARWFIEQFVKADAALRIRGAAGQGTARRWMNVEFANMQQAVEWAEENDPGLFPPAVFAFGTFLREKCRFSENVRLNESLLIRLIAESDPAKWAATQNNLGNAYRNLPTGDRGENLGKAIECYEAALGVWTEHDSPKQWAMSQNNLGIAYGQLPTGDRDENLGKAIGCFEAALRVRTERDTPEDWARTQNNLGIAYRTLPTGDRDENLRKAIRCYEAALRVRTERDFPKEWAITQNNLGNAYHDLPTGDMGENLMKAIACYEAALRVRTEHDFPREWAMTQNNLGLAYQKLPAGNRGENLEKAIACYEAALRVRTEHDFPRDWATTQNNLGTLYKERAVGEPGVHLQMAILCFESAARGFSAVGLNKDAGNALQRAAALKSKGRRS